MVPWKRLGQEWSRVGTRPCVYLVVMDLTLADISLELPTTLMEQTAGPTNYTFSIQKEVVLKLGDRYHNCKGKCRAISVIHAWYLSAVVWA